MNTLIPRTRHMIPLTGFTTEVLKSFFHSVIPPLLMGTMSKWVTLSNILKKNGDSHCPVIANVTKTTLLSARANKSKRGRGNNLESKSQMRSGGPRGKNTALKKLKTKANLTN